MIILYRKETAGLLCRTADAGVLPESSYIHTVHNGQRNQEQAKIFVQQIKDNSDEQAPFIESDVGPPMRLVL